jgi:hypothetical protein
MRLSLQSKRPFGRQGGPHRRWAALLLGALGAIALTLGSGAAGAQRGSRSVSAQAVEPAEQPQPSESGLAVQPFAAAAAPSSDAGHPMFRLDANTRFDRYSNDAAFIEGRVDVVKAYPPFGDVYVQYGKPVIGYHDPATEGYAPLETSQIERFVAAVKRDMGKGYAGVFVDDANWSFSPWPGPEANLANLLEAIRRAEPNALIEMNSQYHDIWPKMKAGDSNVARALAQVNLVTKEFGVGPDAMINGGQDYKEFLEYADALREKGIHLVMAGDDSARSVRVEEYNEATCLLINDGGDYVNASRPKPRHLWKGFAVDLGSALGPRERSSSGLWTRRFSGGVVYTVEPGAPTQTIKLGKRMHSAEWHNVESVTLSAQEGAVLAG